MLFDTHAHMDDEQYNGEREALIASFPDSGVSLFVNIGANLDSSYASVEIAEKYDYAYAAVGVHPEDTGSMTEETISKLRNLAGRDKVVAIGEIGLDYHYGDVPQQTQKKWFRRQLELAKEINLPVIIHDREAHGDCMEIVKDCGYHRGVFHCYSGSVELARQLVDLGWYLSFGGTVTFKNAPKVKAAAKSIPLERILLETDSPYLSPEPYRGKRNLPVYVKYVAQEIAALKEISVEEVEQTTFENGKLFFGII